MDLHKAAKFTDAANSVAEARKESASMQSPKRKNRDGVGKTALARTQGTEVATKNSGRPQHGGLVVRGSQTFW
jgi:hypothetical protein